MLEPAQEAQVADAILLLPPSTVDRRFTRWTKKAIAGFIEQRFGVRLSAWQVDSHLRRWGFESHQQVRRGFLKNSGSDLALAETRRVYYHPSRSGADGPEGDAVNVHWRERA